MYRSPVRLTSQSTLNAGVCRRHTDLATVAYWSDFAAGQLSPGGDGIIALAVAESARACQLARPFQSRRFDDGLIQDCRQLKSARQS